MTEAEAQVQLAFQTTVSALIAILFLSIVAVMVMSHRAYRRLSEHLERILALPPEKTRVWVTSFVSNAYESGPCTEYTLYAQVEGEDAIQITENPDRLKWFCKQMAARGRPVPSAPQWMVDK